MTNAITATINGNTYPVREQIKALGGRWDEASKSWRVPVANADRARALVAGAGQPATRGYARPYGGRATRGRPCGYPGCTGGLSHCDECS